ncbi:MAG: OstA-like protein [Bacteroidales bacterium]
MAKSLFTPGSTPEFLLRVRMQACVMVIVVLLIWMPDNALGQRRVEWIRSDFVEYDQQTYGRVRRAIGNVEFRHMGTYLFCDSAYFYEETNKVEAYSNVHIQDSDTLNLYCDFLEYIPGTRLATARRNVVLVDPQVSLTTEELYYDLEKNLAYYEHDATIVSETNTLKSRKGSYASDNKLFVFEKDVELEHPNFTLYTDTLHYWSNTEVANLYGPTLIRSDENLIYAERGIYDTQKDFSVFWQNAWLQNKESRLAGDSLEYDRNTSFARAFDNVSITDTVNHYVFGGHFGEYDEVSGYSFMTDSAWAVFIDAGDSLTMRADTLYLTFDSLQNGKVFNGYYHVRFFRSDLQGVCDSLVYLFADSTITMYAEPVIWFERTQVVADTIMLLFQNRRLSKMEMINNTFIISDDKGNQYNQIKGKAITAWFDEHELRVMHVHGNTETLYYVRDDGDELIGIDKAISDRLRIEFSEGEVQNIIYFTKVKGTTYPEQDLSAGERELKGFLLRSEERPASREDLSR